MQRETSREAERAEGWLCTRLQTPRLDLDLAPAPLALLVVTASSEKKKEQHIAVLRNTASGSITLMSLRCSITEPSSGASLVVVVTATIAAAGAAGAATAAADTAGIGAAAATGGGAGAAAVRVRVRCERLLLLRLRADGVTQKTLAELGGYHHLAPTTVPVDGVKFMRWRVPLDLRLIRVRIVDMAGLGIIELIPVLTNVGKDAVASVVHATAVATQVFLDAALRRRVTLLTALAAAPLGIH